MIIMIIEMAKIMDDDDDDDVESAVGFEFTTLPHFQNDHFKKLYDHSLLEIVFFFCISANLFRLRKV